MESGRCKYEENTICRRRLWPEDGRRHRLEEESASVGGFLRSRPRRGACVRATGVSRFSEKTTLPASCAEGTWLSTQSCSRARRVGSWRNCLTQWPNESCEK